MPITEVCREKSAWHPYNDETERRKMHKSNFASIDCLQSPSYRLQTRISGQNSGCKGRILGVHLLDHIENACRGRLPILPETPNVILFVGVVAPAVEALCVVDRDEAMRVRVLEQIVYWYGPCIDQSVQVFRLKAVR